MWNERVEIHAKRCFGSFWKVLDSGGLIERWLDRVEGSGRFWKVSCGSMVWLLFAFLCGTQMRTNASPFAIWEVIPTITLIA